MLLCKVFLYLGLEIEIKIYRLGIKEFMQPKFPIISRDLISIFDSMFGVRDSMGESMHSVMKRDKLNDVASHERNSLSLRLMEIYGD